MPYIPFAFCVALVLLWRYVYPRWRKTLEEWIQSAQERRVFFTGIGLVAAGFAALASRLPDFQAIQRGILTASDVSWLCVFAFSTVMAIWVQVVNLSTTDSWNAKHKAIEAEKKAAEDQLANEQQAGFFAQLVSNGFLRAIGVKRINLESDKKRRFDSAEQGLRKFYECANPRRQITLLIQVVYEIFYPLLPQDNPLAKMRVTYFRADRGALAVVHCWDGLCNGCLKTHANEFKRKLKLSPDSGYLAVAVAFSGQIEIVENAEKADKDEKIRFRFFNHSQKNRIKSMVAIPLGEPSQDGYHTHVVCIDTTSAGFFAESSRSQLELVKQNLEHRLLSEFATETMLLAAINLKK